MGQLSNGVFEEPHVNLDNHMWIKANINSQAIIGPPCLSVGWTYLVIVSI